MSAAPRSAARWWTMGIKGAVVSFGPALVCDERLSFFLSFFNGRSTDALLAPRPGPPTRPPFQRGTSSPRPPPPPLTVVDRLAHLQKKVDGSG